MTDQDDRVGMARGAQRSGPVEPGAVGQVHVQHPQPSGLLGLGQTAKTTQLLFPAQLARHALHQQMKQGVVVDQAYELRRISMTSATKSPISSRLNRLKSSSSMTNFSTWRGLPKTPRSTPR